jgi:hypothetical protein
LYKKNQKAPTRQMGETLNNPERRWRAATCAMFTNLLRFKKVKIMLKQPDFH